MKFTAKIASASIKLAGEGHYITTIFAALGINRDTYYDWRARGLRGEAPFAEWLRLFDQAVAKHEMRLAKDVLKIARAQKNSSGLMEFMARRYASRWGNRLRIDSEALDELIDQQLRLHRMAGASYPLQDRAVSHADETAVTVEGSDLALAQPVSEPEDWEELPSEHAGEDRVSQEREAAKGATRRVRRGKDKRGRD